MFPKNDDQFEETIVNEVAKEKGGWEVKRADGWIFFVPKNSVEPKKGMTARFYGTGIGSPVRGLFLNGKKVFYRTEADDQKKRDIDLYGENVTEWLKRWDKGQTVWSISMGGLGPGYEQCIHTVAEILRFMLSKKYKLSKWENKLSGVNAWKHDRDEIEHAVLKVPVIDKLGLSGAQWGAAMNLALQFYQNGPCAVMKDEKVKDRHIQVSRTFP